MVGETASEMGGQYIRCLCLVCEVRKEKFDPDQDVRGEAWAGPGRERDRCICIIAPSGGYLTVLSSFPASRCQYTCSKQQSIWDGMGWDAVGCC
jgi:hypothetical protein